MKILKKFRLFFIILGSLFIFFLAINIIPPKKIANNPFIKAKDAPTMIAAHRGGGKNNPENTMKAFSSAVKKYDVDILESDLYLTKDGYLVYNHDSYIDETCNVNGDISYDEMNNLIKDKNNRHYIKDYTLEDLREFNFGYYFTQDNSRIYKDVNKNELKDQGLQIVEASELFETFYETNPDLMFIVEIKNSSDEGKFAVDTLINIINTKYPNYKNKIVIGTFHPEIEDYLTSEYPTFLRGASTKGAAKFIISQMLRVNIFNRSTFACLQIPKEYDIKGINIDLTKKNLVRRAHRRGMAVQYWTINDEETMRDLIDLGCDAIMTDDVALCRQVVDSYK